MSTQPMEIANNNIASINLKGCLMSIVKPCDPTWKGIMALSELDQIGTLTHVPFIYLYLPSSNNNSTSVANYAHTLKQSLSRALVPFYPLAGRLQWIDDNNNKGRLELHCNAMGAQFIEAHSSMDQWARLARGEPLQTMLFLDRSVLRGGEPPTGPPSLDHSKYMSSPPLLLGCSNINEERSKKTTTVMLKLSKDEVEKLRKIANKSWAQDKLTGGKRFTRYETIAGHIWRSACKARGLKKEQLTELEVCVDSRSRMKPNLPKEYFGNATFDVVVATSFVGELLSKPLGYAASKVREVIEKVTDEYIRSLIETLKNEEDLTRFQDIHDLVVSSSRTRSEEEKWPFCGNPNIGVVSWHALPIYGLDFGWGDEFLMGPGPDASIGCSLIMNSPEGDGSLVVVICLQVNHMDAFRNHFYQDIIMSSM